MFAMFGAGMVIIAACSRQVFAMARDKRFPAHELMKKVNPKTQTPVPATLLILAVGVVLMLALPGDALIPLIVGSTLLPALIYGGIVILYLAVRKRLEHKEGGFSLGRFEMPVAVAALIWEAFVLFVLVTPGGNTIPVADRRRPRPGRRRLLRVHVLLPPRDPRQRTGSRRRRRDRTGRDRMTSTSTRPVELTGRIVRPGDDDYRTASDSWNLLFSHDPAVIVFAQETRDVVNALAWARQNDVAVRVRSGGHCLEGWSTVDDGIVIDVSEMKSASIDPSSNTATVGAGLNQLEAVTALGKAGFAAPTGTEGTVGLVGATLGGGFGLLTRLFGMASDNLLAAEIVVASDDGGARDHYRRRDTPTPTCSGRCAAQATATSASSPP